MQEKAWSNQEVISILQRIDNGYKPKRKEKEYLRSLRKLEIGQEMRTGFTSTAKIPASISMLAALQVLNINNASIAFLPDEVAQLKSLERLDLSFSGIVCLPDGIGQLENLQYLSLRVTKITELPDTICQLDRLKELILYGTQIDKIDNWIGNLKSLQILDVRYSHITSLPDALECISSLNQIYISNTNIKDLPEKLALGRLPIVNTEISSEPGIYANMTKLPGWYFEGKEVVARYLSEEERGGFHDVKIVFLGYGNTGKTYTINRFISKGQKARPGQDYGGDETHGVGIYDYEHKTSSREGYMLHLWDFGGQEMFHSMHRCFLTKDTVYVLMVSSRSEQQTHQLYYWLSSVLPYIAYQYDNAPVEDDGWKPKVTIIENCYNDYKQPDVDEELLRRKFEKEIRLEFIPISVKDADQKTFESKIMTPLIELAIEVDKHTVHPPISYINVSRAIKIELEAYGYLAKSKYIECCNANNVDNAEEQTQLISHFTNLGVCLCAGPIQFAEGEKEYRLVRPIWLTNALYAIICECESSNGIVSKQNIRRRLTSQQPPRDLGPRYHRFDPSIKYVWDDIDYILYLAAKEDLLYEAPMDPDSLFIPAMCRYDDQPEDFELPINPPFYVQYEVVYPYLPETTIQKLMVHSMKNCLILEGRWRGGFFAVGRNCKAKVNTDFEKSTIKFDLWSSNGLHPIKDLFETFRDMLGLGQNLHPEIEEFIIREPDRFSVVELLNAESTEIKEIPSKKSYGKKYNVQELLGSYPDKAIQHYKEQIIMNVFNGPYYDQRISNDGGKMAVNYGALGNAMVNSLPNE